MVRVKERVVIQDYEKFVNGFDKWFEDYKKDDSNMFGKVSLIHTFCDYVRHCRNIAVNHNGLTRVIRESNPGSTIIYDEIGGYLFMPEE